MIENTTVHTKDAEDAAAIKAAVDHLNGLFAEATLKRGLFVTVEVDERRRVMSERYPTPVLSVTVSRPL